LIFRNFLSKIFRKSKMGYAPHHRLSAEQAAEAAVSGSSARKAPEGKAWNKADNFCLIVRKHDEARGSLDVRKGFPFLPKKMKFAEFFSGKGKAWNKADNFCLIVRKHDEARGSRE